MNKYYTEIGEARGKKETYTENYKTIVSKKARKKNNKKNI